MHEQAESHASGNDLDVDRFYHGLPVPPACPGHLEGTLVPGTGGRVYLTYEEADRTAPDPNEHYLYPVIRESDDAGRTWGEPRDFRDSAGERIGAWHVTVFRLDDTRLGLVCNDRKFRRDGPPGRDGGTKITFRSSTDEGRTWSDPVLVYPLNALCCSGHALQLSNGRILVPAFRWISHDATGESEESCAPSLSFSFACTSDDCGATWQVSHSQLFVSHYRLACDLEEPTVVALRDGRLLMHLRSQLGRPFRSCSTDHGLTWSRPEPLPMAASYTPSLLKRMPTGEILMIWSQASRAEILKGLSRHRLSCAVSRDDGATWENFKNLESLDFRTVLSPPPLDRHEIIDQWEERGYDQPDSERYPRAPGVLRTCYPSVVFHGDEALVVYDYGGGTLGDNTHGIKLRAIPLDWFLLGEQR